MRHDLTLGEFVAVDPSISSAGIALFRAGQVTAAATVKLARKTEQCHAVRCLAMAESLARWITRQDAAPRVLVFEWPQIYRGAKSKGDPNDLPGLAGVGMGLAGILAMGVAARDITLEVLSYTPAEWTGAAGKKSTKAAEFETAVRTNRIRKRLTDAELEAIEGIKSHDAFDAIGLGLHALGRLEPIRIYPGAS